MSWDFDNQSGGGGKKAEFCSFPEGVTIIRCLDKEPRLRYTHWVERAKRSINCPGKGCPICEVIRQQRANKEQPTWSSQKKLSMNIINRNTEKVEIMDEGVTFRQGVRDVKDDLADEGKSILDADIKIRRRGLKKDNTTYRHDVDKEYPLSNEDLALVEEGKIDLDEYFKPHDPDKILRIMQGEDWNEVFKREEKPAEDIELA
jgi:hypothetical protein